MKDVLYIIDDHNMVRNGLKSWLEGHTNWKVVKDFEKGSDCLEFLNQLPVDNELFPEILIVDVQLVDESGFALVKEITKQFPQIKTVMYSMNDTAGLYCRQKIQELKHIFQKLQKKMNLLTVWKLYRLAELISKYSK